MDSTQTTTKKTRKRRAKTKRYFTQEHEDAILEYCSTDSRERREALYANSIQPVFDEMVEKIVYTYNFHNLPNNEELREDCKVFLVTILDKFNPNKGHKAFTYFTVVTKNWFIAEYKKRKKKLEKEIELDDMPDSFFEEKLAEENTFIEDTIKKEFFEYFYEEMEWWRSETTNVQDKKVIDAVYTLFEESENIDIFNKKAIYVYLREITGFNTKQITNSLTKFRKKYRAIKQEWDNSDF